MSKDFWEDSISIGYYDELLKKGIKHNKGIQPTWHHLTFLEISEDINNENLHLDYATGPGTFIGLYLENDKAIGVDISNQQIKFARSNYPENKFYTLEEFDSSNYQEYFETISVIGLIEFLSDEEIVKLIKYLKSLLKVNGEIIFSTPNFRGFMNLFSILLKYIGPVNYQGQWVNKFNKKTLTKLLKANNINNFSIEKHLNLALVLSFFSLNLGTKASRFFSKLFKYNIGWLLILKLNK
tara:strand:- start:1119 stop:1835 length:717 start_codon:yes stop_codon:yes gene_type:complete